MRRRLYGNEYYELEDADVARGLMLVNAPRTAAPVGVTAPSKADGRTTLASEAPNESTLTLALSSSSTP